MIDEFIHGLHVFFTFGSRYPFQSKPVLSNAEILKHLPEKYDPSKCFVITLHVMTVTGMASADKYPISPLLEGKENVLWVDSARAHDPQIDTIGFILHPGCPSQVSTGIGTPFAQVTHNFWFEHGYPFNIAFTIEKI